MNITDPIFHDEAKAAEHIFESRWPDGEPTCPHCDSTNCMVMGGKTQAGYWLCRDCRDKFTVRTGTVMERSHVPLHKWLLATHLMAASKKGMSAKQMERMLGVTYKTAWFLCHRVREAMAGAADPSPLGGPGQVIESDEAFVGGFKRKRLSGKVAAKKKIVTLVERGGLDGDHPTHQEMDEHLRGLNDTAFRILETVWFVRSQMGGEQLHSYIAKILSSAKDKLVVFEVTDAVWNELLVSKKTFLEAWHAA